MAAGGAPQFASLYVGDLSPDVTEAMLYEIFNSVGPVGSIRVCRDSVTRRSLGYGYVNFHSVSDAERALDTLNYSSIKGRACRIMWSQRDPSLRKSGVGNIFVKNLDRNIDNKALYDTFSLFGNILSCKVASDANGKSRGYGFVHYETEEAAKQSIERVNGMQIGEKTVEVTRFLKRDERDAPVVNFTNIYVKNVPADFDEEKLKSMFGGYGTITSEAIMEDKQNRKFCFINYETTEAAQKAVEEMNGKDLRTEEQKAEQKEEDEPDSYLLYVGRAMSKSERARELRSKMTQEAAAPGRAAGVNLYVKNLDENTTNESLKELFDTFGTITSCIAMRDEKEKCKGFGFVCYASPDEATKAVTEMHLKVVQGKPLYVGLAEKKEARQERLRQRYQPGAGGAPMGGKGGKDNGKGMGKGMGPMGGKGMGGPQGMGMGCQGGMGMGGPQMMGNPQMMGMMGGKGGMMCNPMQMMGQKGGMMGGPMAGMMGAKGAAGMMGNPQMMGMMGKGGPGMMPPQMMGMMGKGAPMPGPMGMMRPMMPMMPQPGMMGKGGPMPTQQQGAPQQPQQPQPGAAPAAAPAPGGPLTAAALAAAPPGVQKQMLGEKLFPAISKYQPELAGKITGMMLEMDNSELLILLESESQLKSKVDEAMRVLEGSK